MPQTQFYPLLGCLSSAEEMQTALAASKLRLFKSPFAPIPSTARADYLAVECDYKGYTAGGETIAAFNDPILAPGTGYQIGSPLVQFAYDSGDAGEASNLVSGGWIEDSGGVIRMAFTFAEQIPMQTDGQGIPLNLIFPFPAGV